MRMKSRVPLLNPRVNSYKISFFIPSDAEPRKIRFEDSSECDITDVGIRRSMVLSDSSPKGFWPLVHDRRTASYAWKSSAQLVSI